jgi:hypothetical protein
VRDVRGLFGDVRGLFWDAQGRYCLFLFIAAEIIAGSIVETVRAASWSALFNCVYRSRIGCGLLKIGARSLEMAIVHKTREGEARNEVLYAGTSRLYRQLGRQT